MSRRHTEAELYPRGRPQNYHHIKVASRRYDEGIVKVRALEKRYGLKVWDRRPDAPIEYRRHIKYVENILRPALDEAWERFHIDSLQAMAPAIIEAIRDGGGRLTLSALRVRCRPAGTHLTCYYWMAIRRLRKVPGLKIAERARGIEIEGKN